MTTTPVETDMAASPMGMGVPFTVASRPQRRFSNVQNVSPVSGGSLTPISLPATGWVRRISVYVSAQTTFASGGSLLTGDGPFRAISGITVTDATGQPIQQPISGFNWYLVNKYAGVSQKTKDPVPWQNPMLSPEYAFSNSSTAGNAVFRADIDFEIDPMTGYGCIPNLDSNASLQLKIDYNPFSSYFSGTTASAQALQVVVGQEYWAPVAASAGGVPIDSAPPGAGDFLETRYETQTVSASSENLVTLTNRGGLIKNIIVVSRAAGVRTAFTAGSNVGLLLDNQPINEGITLEAHNDLTRRQYGYYGTDLTVANGYATPTAGVMTGLDVGVLVFNFDGLSGGRNSWLNTRAGSLLQLKLTPGASATQLEVITQLAQVKDHAAFFAA